MRPKGKQRWQKLPKGRERKKLLEGKLSRLDLRSRKLTTCTTSADKPRWELQ